MKCKSPRLLKAVIFCCLFLLLFFAANKVFQPVWYEWNNYYTYTGFYDEPENSIETVFLGTSATVTGLSPMELYAEYGLCSYNLASEQQPLFASYYWLLEAHRLHAGTLKNVVLDVSMLRRVADDPFYRKALDPMALSPLKLQALWDYADADAEDFLACLFPFFSYHSRWAELNENDFSKGRVDSSNGTRGQHFLWAHHIESPENLRLIGIPPEKAEPEEADKEALLYLEKMAAFCRKNDLALILIKTPTDTWTNGWHRTAVDFAQKHSLPFLDFNYPPLYDELGYCYPFDNMDNNHLNVDGARKLTHALGHYLVGQQRTTDVRGSALGRHLDEQLLRYRSYTAPEMRRAGDIVSFLSAAMTEENTVILSVRDEGSASLTKAQRSALAGLGLKKLAALSYRDSYLAVIGSDGTTEMVKSAEKTAASPLTFTAVLPDRMCTVTSGGFEHGNISSIVLDEVEYSKNERGINVVVYNSLVTDVIYSAAFDTFAADSRDVYSPDIGPRATASAALCLCKDPLDYLETAISGNNIVLIALRDDGGSSLTEEQRQRSRAIGLTQLAGLGCRESYLAVLDGDFRMEAREEAPDYTYSYEDHHFSLKSRSITEGNMASLCVDGRDYSKNSRGLNILVYSKELNAVIDSAVFDTHASPVRRPFTLKSLNIYELIDCSVYEQAQLYEVERYTAKQKQEGGAA